MKVESIVPVRVDREGRSFFGEFMALIALAALLLAPTAAESGGGSSGKPSTEVKFESIPNSNLKRVILTAKAAERLGIETGEIGKTKIVLKQMVGGRVVPPQKSKAATAVATKGWFGGFGKVAAATAPKPVPVSTSLDESWVAVTLSQGEWDKLRKDSQARILPLSSRDKTGNAVMAMPVGNAPIRDMKRSMLKVYYKVPGKDHGLTLYHRVRVELRLMGSDEEQMVVPYSSVYYDGQGVAWVYINPKPLVYERKRIKVTRVVGDLAVLSDGPPVGTTVVTVGAALLYGAEVIYKR